MIGIHDNEKILPQLKITWIVKTMEWNREHDVMVQTIEIKTCRKDEMWNVNALEYRKSEYRRVMKYHRDKEYMTIVM